MELDINIGRAIREQAACAYAWQTFADAEALPRDAVQIQVHLTAQAQVMVELTGGGPLSRRSRQTRQGRSVRIELLTLMFLEPHLTADLACQGIAKLSPSVTKRQCPGTWPE
jgi:hypothetical protein